MFIIIDHNSYSHKHYNTQCENIDFCPFFPPGEWFHASIDIVYRRQKSLSIVIVVGIKNKPSHAQEMLWAKQSRVIKS